MKKREKKQGYGSSETISVTDLNTFCLEFQVGITL